MSKTTLPPVVMVFVLWAAGLGAAAQFAKVGVVLPQLAEVYPQAGASLGFLVSILSLLGAILGLVAGMIVARVGYRSVLLWSLALGVALSLHQASMPSFEMMLLSRFVEGISHLGIVVAASTLIAQTATGRMQSAAMALWGTFFGVAFAIVAVFGVPLVAMHGLSALFLVHAAVMALVGGVLFWWLPKDTMAHSDTNLLDIGAVLRRHAIVYTSPFLYAAALGWIFYTLMYVSLVSILPDTVPAGSRANVATFMPVAGIVVALTLGVLMLRKYSGVTVAMIGFGAAAIMAVFMIIFPGNPVVTVGLFFATGLIQSGSFAAIPQLNASAVDRALANGAVAQAGNIGNLVGVPLMLGLLNGAGYGAMMGVAALIFAAGVLGHWALSRMRAAQQV